MKFKLVSFWLDFRCKKKKKLNLRGNIYLSIIWLDDILAMFL